MKKRLANAMASVEAGKGLEASADEDFRFAVLSALGSKYLAVGAPDSLGLVECGAAASLIVSAHELIFGELEIRSAGDNDLAPNGPTVELSVEECMAGDIICLSSDLDFETAWIAVGSHLNVRSQKVRSDGFQQLLKAWPFSCNTMGLLANIPLSHGSLSEVILGKTSGRVGDEISGLLCDVLQDTSGSP